MLCMLVLTQSFFTRLAHNAGMTRKTWAAAVLALIFTAAAVWLWQQRPSTAPALEVQAGPLQRSLQFSARASSRARVDVGATITGRVQAVRVQAGDTVKAGDVLVQMEADDAQAAVAQALASEQQARARLAGLRQTSRSVAAATEAQGSANLAAARAELTRTESLVAQGFLSPARLDESRRALAVAQAQAEAAAAQRAALADGIVGTGATAASAGTELLQAQAQLSTATAGVAAARARLAQTQVLAPTAAKVLVRSTEPGQIVQPGRVLLSLALQTPLELVAQVDERHLEQLAIGQPAFALADAFSGQRLVASVSRIAPVIDAQRGAVEVRLALNAAPPAFLREDMTLSIEVQTGQRERAIAVPLAALSSLPDGSAQTWVEKDGRATMRRVQTGLRTLQAVEVTQGLQAGDKVLLGGNYQEGQRIKADTAAGQAWLARSAKAEDVGSAMTSTMTR